LENKYIKKSFEIIDYISEKIENYVIPESIKRKVIEAVSKDLIEKFSIFTTKFSEKNLDFKDAVHIGQPIDFIVFDGWSKGSIEKIIFLEIKSSPESKLTNIEKTIKDCVENKKVYFDQINFSEEKITSKIEIENLIKEEIKIKDWIKKLIKNEEIIKILKSK